MLDDSVKKLKRYFPEFDKFDKSFKDWLEAAGNRLNWKDEDFITYTRLVTSKKDMAFFRELNLDPSLSYYVVSPRREFLEKFRIYFQVHGPRKLSDYIKFTSVVSLNTYVQQTKQADFNIDDLVVSGKRLLVYCHSDYKFMTDKHQAWIQGNLFCSDICDRLIRGNKVLILSEYKVNEIEGILGRFKIRKIDIKDSDLICHGLYTLSKSIVGTSQDNVSSVIRDNVNTTTTDSGSIINVRNAGDLP